MLPLKLEWEPFYSAAEDVSVGDRVRVCFAGRHYLGAVTAVGVQLPPEISESSVREIYGVASEKTPLTATELEFFRKIASYYMCTVGEVYKAAYPAVKDETVRVRAAKDVAATGEGCAGISAEALSLVESFRDDSARPGKPVLVSSSCAVEALRVEALSRLKDGGNVLWLVPEVKFSKDQEKQLRSVFGDKLILYGSNITPAKKREAFRRVRGETSHSDKRDGEQYIMVGTRSALFLPHRDLKMVVVQEEESVSYKQSSPAPRYNGRDAAILLASIFEAKVFLESVAPSLESIYNCLSGKYLWVKDESLHAPVCEIIDTGAELRKNGMLGCVPRRLAIATQREKLAVFKPYYAAFPTMEELSADVAAALGPGVEVVDNLIPYTLPSDLDAIALFGIDSLLGRQDFRADEKVLQTILTVSSHCSRIFIMTREPSANVFALLGRGGDLTSLLSERKEFDCPPFTRYVDVLISDTFPDRLARMERVLLSELVAAGFTVLPAKDGCRVVLRKDAALIDNKRRLASLVSEFEKSRKYPGHIVFDVDPR